MRSSGWSLLFLLAVCHLCAVEFEGSWEEGRGPGSHNPAADPPWTTVTIRVQDDGSHAVTVLRRRHGMAEPVVLARHELTGGQVAGRELSFRDAFGDEVVFHILEADPDTLHAGTLAQHRERENTNAEMDAAGMFMAIGGRSWRRVDRAE